MLHANRLLVLLVIALLLALPAAARTIHVPRDVETIQGAIDRAVSGDTVLVAPGTYNERINFNGKDITLRGAEGAERTVLTHDEGIVYMGPMGVIEGFTLRDCRKTALTARRFGSVIQDCIFENNGVGTYQDTTCIGVSAGSPVIRRNIFRFNQGGMGYGSCVIGGAAHAENNLFHDNASLCINFLLPRSAQAYAVNNTIVDCGAGIYGGYYVANNIIVGCNTAMHRHHNMPNDWRWENNILFGNEQDYGEDSRDEHGGIERGTLRADPRFADPGTYDFRPRADSPAVDAAAAQSHVPDDDLARTPRPAPRTPGEARLPDIGAYEFVPEGYTAPAALAPRDTAQFVLIRAAYGRGSAFTDITPTIAQAITPEGLRLTVDSHATRINRIDGKRMTLTLHYRIGPREYHRAFPEGERVHINTPVPHNLTPPTPNRSRPITVVEAFYGTGVEIEDRTEWLNAVAADGKTQLLVSPETIYIDPAPGRRKTLTVAYYLHDTYLTAAVSDGEMLYLVPTLHPDYVPPEDDGRDLEQPTLVLPGESYTQDPPTYTPDDYPAGPDSITPPGSASYQRPAAGPGPNPPAATDSIEPAPVLPMVVTTVLIVVGVVAALIVALIVLLLLYVFLADRRTAGEPGAE